MQLIVGFVIVFGSIIAGYLMHHGQLGVLLQWNEFLIIGGAGIGAFVVGNPAPVIKGSVSRLLGLLKPDPYKPEVYADLLKMIYEIMQIAARDGLVGLDQHIEDPEKSPVFKKYPFFLANHHAVAFFTDTLKSLSSGAIEDHHLADVLDADLEKHHNEEKMIPAAITKMGDAMPGFGIVAAVLGVVITMQSIGGAASEIGEKVAAALVGTFLGILLAYGVIGPMASAVEARLESEHTYLICLRAALLAFARGDAPKQTAEAARRSLEPHVRPTFSELEALMKGTKTQNA
ncbi:MAG: flagellar motor stator protein MotA [Gemmatimonadaceae bacterium]|nr:flagellar motor stator protein MotA [Gemmatimonadaceae bacterium]